MCLLHPQDDEEGSPTAVPASGTDGADRQLLCAAKSLQVHAVGFGKTQVLSRSIISFGVGALSCGASPRAYLLASQLPIACTAPAALIGTIHPCAHDPGAGGDEDDEQPAEARPVIVQKVNRNVFKSRLPKQARAEPSEPAPALEVPLPLSRGPLQGLMCR